MAKKNTRTLKFEALDKELQNLLYNRDNSKPISVLKEGKNPLHLEQLAQLDVKSCKNLGFPVLWELYENDFIPFEEDFLIEKLCDALFLMSKHKEIESFILKRPVIAQKLCTKLPFYLSDKFSTNTFLYDNLLILAKKEYFKDTQVLANLLEVLLSPLKTSTANSYCRLIEDFNPTTEELLPSQQTLFALLSSDKTSVVNFVMKLIKQIVDEKVFDFQNFADNFALCFTTQKIAKSQLIGLNILEKHYKKQAPINIEYREQLAVLFTVPDVKLQEKVTNLLTTYFGGEGLAEVVAPYQDYLKGKAQDLLATLSLSENSENSQTACVDRTSQTACATRSLTPITYPLRPEDLLFLLGDCLRERTAITIDLFFEGLVQLQDQLPENFKEQLAPYITQVNGMYYTNVQLAALQLLLAGWVEDRPLESPEDWTKMNTKVRRLNTTEEEPFKQACVLHNVWYLRDEIPYLLYKVRATLSKLKSGNKLPFLSTPTYAPFYMDAETLADRLLAYQTAGKEVDLDDLVVACNRLLLSTITPEAQEKVRLLSGQYAPALGYLFGLSDVVTPTEELLPLWTQITRLKHPNKVFTEFETTAAKDYLSAVKPFFLSYEIDSENKWFYLEKKYINSPYNDYQRRTFEKEEDRLPYNYYNAGAFQIFDVDILRYTISLNPQYVDVLLGKYTPPWVGVSDAETYHNLQVPLQLLLEYDLPVHHGGWIFVGMALLHDKKETRDLATEYILRAISRDEDLSYLQHFLADILAQKLTPINRFMEFLDIPTRDPKIKAFQKAVVEAYLPLAEKQEKKPTNHKKLANWLIS
ncbi:DUF6493 family protein [Capnocytophaga gingivalis]|uniref:DUF6493 family protein n=1 Tax=Capnocytophaga gingivalis TaxID=1017 RepID=A0ABU5YDB6_9FLAO|nr:DUF6493 family protein [Capnocytophaga gingivalis]MEB3040934.1 DUF6493 family protein [Capnocytophaga gingivalis]